MKSVHTELTLPKLLAWVETKPPGEHFEFSNGETCAIAQYLRANNVHFKYVGGWTVATEESCEPVRIPANIRGAIQCHPRTFGWLAEALKTASENPLT